ncbi:MULTISPECIES: ExbD/TolR family protein [Zhongshania]|jgi:biopolymer transport protein ExbD|uniref:Biopolymer transporter ExbD n=4 Tax=Zhongshania TaxID=1434050 RepID=A0A127M9E0_9GAMM|nr:MULTISPECIES: biopolymer transporter ExbD [Zhongshania]AMO69805.1 biopolymer transporter ExbD [Zhongshania aliphaticivorans]EIF41922.1 biopolymer transport protein [gamma proteobacterium BDW918]MBB5186439.1 biopolymer transport protein ExbD [Zhongshania antarctica]|tara:strand:- start:84485 stop:84892 length:408 start_codon:yes stop_codon:yes gene_type:complete
MRRNKRGGQEDNPSEIDLTPMLDVVFIMLIFFIVTASFIKEAGVEVNRPDASTSSKKENVNILIAVTATNEIWIDKRRVDKRAVRSVVERMHAENPKGAVVIQADKASNTETVTAVIDASRSAGVYDVSLATEDS